ncbi:helix-turn-helix domain-containing protein [Mycobacterium dioxanotrophicus]|uniref:helix-turn-helix domain-containing protein n=1 Tax=Mycobacterium dioxanotrophicus TaxID=482462 RepID=UPI00269CB2CF
MVTVKAPTNRRHHRGVPLKSAKDRMDIISAYQQLGSYRAAAEACGTTHRTVKKIIDKFEADQAGVPPAPRTERAHNYDAVAHLVAERVEKSQGRISATRLLPIARAAGRVQAVARRCGRRAKGDMAQWCVGSGEHGSVQVVEVVDGVAPDYSESADGEGMRVIVRQREPVISLVRSDTGNTIAPPTSSGPRSARPGACAPR